MKQEDKKIIVSINRCEGKVITEHERIFSFDEKYAEDARGYAETRIMLGKAIIIRNAFNERGADGSFFREYRSFDGEPLKEFRFGFGA